MAHEIQDNEMFSVRRTPWHRNGVVLDNPPTTAEAIIAAKLDWEVRKAQNYIRTDESTPFALHHPELSLTEAPSMTTYRTSPDGPIVLGTVTDRYVPVQNVRAFETFDKVLIDNGYTYETAGAIKKGRKVWILAKSPAAYEVGGDDIEKYVLMVTSHDGSANLRLLPTGVRVVCNNTLMVAMRRGEEQGFSIRHTGDVEIKLRYAEKALEWSNVNFAEAVDLWNMMATLRIEPMAAIRYFDAVIPSLKKRHDDSKAWKRAFDVIAESYMYGRGNKGQTLWHAYNAITEYVDHLKNVAEDRVIDYAVFGDGARIKLNAMVVARQMIAEDIF